jgi:hypothetical protein
MHDHCLCSVLVLSYLILSCLVLSCLVFHVHISGYCLASAYCSSSAYRPVRPHLCNARRSCSYCHVHPTTALSQYFSQLLSRHASLLLVRLPLSLAARFCALLRALQLIRLQRNSLFSLAAASLSLSRSQFVTVPTVKASSQSALRLFALLSPPLICILLSISWGASILGRTFSSGSGLDFSV